MVEHDQKSQVRHAVAEELAQLAGLGRHLLVRHPELTQQGTQYGSGVACAADAAAPEVGVDLAVREEPGGLCSEVHGEGAGAHAVRTVHQGEPGPPVGAAGRLLLELLHRLLAIREEPYGGGEVRPHRPGRGGLAAHAGGESGPGGGELRIGAQPVVDHAGDLFPFVRGHGCGDLTADDSPHDASGGLPGPFAGLVGHPRADRAEYRRNRRHRSGIEHVAHSSFPVFRAVRPPRHRRCHRADQR